ncbi:FHA domain-containing protein [Trichothermofontia sp.]
MIICPNCSHQNPDGAVQCESCYTPLPATLTCPSCGATVQADAHFCGQCGFNLQGAAPLPETEVMSSMPTTAEAEAELASLGGLDPLVTPDPLAIPPLPDLAELPEFEPGAVAMAAASGQESTFATVPEVSAPPTPIPAVPAAPIAGQRTQLQQQTAHLLHLQTNTTLELPQGLTVIHIGKPNDRIPPDVDVSGFPNSDIVSRVHADIRLEGDDYYLEDVGSSNGTYVNNLPLAPGNRHRLRPGDRIALGKGDLVTFLFQLT